MIALPAARSHRPLSVASRVEETLRSFGPFRFSNVSVRLLNGRLALTGTVPSPFAKSLAVDLARSTAAKHDVVDALTIVELDLPSTLASDRNVA